LLHGCDVVENQVVLAASSASCFADHSRSSAQRIMYTGIRSPWSDRLMMLVSGSSFIPGVSQRA